MASKNTNGYTASNGRFCHAVTSGMIFSLIWTRPQNHAELLAV